MPRTTPSDIILQRMTDKDREDLAAIEYARIATRRDLKKLRDRIRARIGREIAKEGHAS